MPVEMTIDVPGGTLRIQGNDQKELFKQAAFWQSLPTVCPIDDSPVRLEFRNPQDYEYYMLVSTGPFPFEYKLGIRKDDGVLFPKNTWTYYDPKAKEEVVVWEYGRLKKENLPENRGVRATRPSPSTTTRAGEDDDEDERPRSSQKQVENANSDEAKKRRKGQVWVMKALEKEGVPEKMYGAVLTSMLGKPIHDDLTRLKLEDAQAVREYLDNIPEGIENAWTDLKNDDPDAAAADGSDLDEDAPDFF